MVQNHCLSINEHRLSPSMAYVLGQEAMPCLLDLSVMISLF